MFPYLTFYVFARRHAVIIIDTVLPYFSTTVCCKRLLVKAWFYDGKWSRIIWNCYWTNITRKESWKERLLTLSKPRYLLLSTKLKSVINWLIIRIRGKGTFHDSIQLLAAHRLTNQFRVEFIRRVRRSGARNQVLARLIENEWMARVVETYVCSGSFVSLLVTVGGPRSKARLPPFAERRANPSRWMQSPAVPISDGAPLRRYADFFPPLSGEYTRVVIGIITRAVGGRYVQI